MDTALLANATIAQEQRCGLQRSSVSSAYTLFLMHIGSIFLACKLLHMVLRRLYQPRIVSDLIVALMIGKVPSLRLTFGLPVSIFVNHWDQYYFAAYMFALGLEMDPFTVFLSPTTDIIISYGGLVSTAAMIGLLYLILLHLDLGIKSTLPAIPLAFIGAFASTSSPVLTRVITELKISKTAVGRLAVDAGLHADMVATFLTSIGIMLYGHRSKQIVWRLIGLISLMGVIAVTVRPVLIWINKRNPEGRRMRGADMAGVAAMACALCVVAVRLHGDVNMAVFLVGLALPREGRVSRLLINNINYVLSTAVLPLYLCYVCIALRFHAPEAGDNSHSDYIMDSPISWEKLVVVSILGALGKVLGTFVAGRFRGLNWLESLALGVLLNMKGYYHIYCAFQAVSGRMISDGLFVALFYVVFETVTLTPAAGFAIATWARRGVERRMMMGLQFVSPTSELRIVMGLHGVENIPMAVKFIEAMRPEMGPEDLVVYAVDMVEMTERAAATLVKGEGPDAVTVGDEAIAAMRKEIGEALIAYQQENGDGLKIRRLLAVSSFSDMHKDICSCATDVGAVVIVLPFHKKQKMDGSMDNGHSGFRQVLQHAPCSVGILVNRELGRVNRFSVSEATQNVAVIFIGGADDREALTLGARMSQHPGIRLTVIRFLPDDAAHARASAQTKRGHSILATASEEELQMQADDQYFAEFYQQYVANKKVGYMEKHVTDGAELVLALRPLEGQYQLFVVGRGGDRSSLITNGLIEWAECPEIGPVGDVIASTEFSKTASVLIIQQHDIRKRFKVIDDEFMPL
uniref:Uncharacterized protein n=1 Tax=Ananas comosus var. bracteatus TaxID=296719 RepID=A0A6V7QJG7_ANACO|nr:unnamed protein product [Ananas comosus var. bracteatus]